MSRDNKLFGRGSEVLHNEKLHKIVKQLETLTLPEGHPLLKNPQDKRSLWIDENDENDLKYNDNGKWVPFYKNKFRITTEILEQYAPKDPVTGQLWINDGVLMYFDGAEWIVVKAGDINKEEFNISNYHDFIIIDPLIEQGSLIVDESKGHPIKKSQFLVPNEETTKFFIDGHINNDYDKITNVAIQYDTDRIENKITSAVHINPSNLVNIKKSFILIDKTSSDNLIRVNAHNKEFYGFTHGRGRILIDSIDYRNTSGNYIKLSEKTKRKFDFIMVIEYVFGKTKNKGKLLRKDTNIKKEGVSRIKSSKDVYDHLFIIFENGYPKSIDRKNYEVNDDNEIILKYNASNTKTQILSIHNDNVLEYGQVKNEDYIEIDIESAGKVDHLFALIESTKGYELKSIMTFQDGKGYIDNLLIGSRYLIFNTNNDLSKTSIDFIKEGTIFDNYIDIENNKNIKDYMLFIEGRSIPREEYEVDNIKGRIILKKDYEFSNYILFSDHQNNVVLDKTIRQMLIPLYDKDGLGYNKSIVYIDEHIVCDPSTVVTSNFPVTGYNNEVKKIFTKEGFKWYIYTNGSWTELKNKYKKDIKLIDNSEKKETSKTIEVYNSKNLEEVKMEVLREIKSVYDVNEKEIEKLSVNTIGKNVISNFRIKGEEYNLYADLKEVQIKVPSVFYHNDINTMLELESEGEDNNSTVYLKEIISESIKDKILLINNNIKLRFKIKIKSNIASVEVVQDFGDTGNNDYREGIGIIEHLEYSTNTYIEEDHNINLANSFGGHRVKSYSYRFSSHIEKPRKIREFDIDLSKNEEGYKIDHQEFYKQGNQELSIYLDGVKQYEFQESPSNNSFKFYGEYSITDPRYGTVLAVSEPVERNESISALREIIQTNNGAPGMLDTYKTTIDLYPGFNRVFIDGIRQSSDSYDILDSNTIMIKNINKVINKNSLILIEHKNDLSIKEKTIYVREPLHDGIIDLNKYEIDLSILESKEDLLIYIDGVLLGNKYSIDEETETIKIETVDADTIGKNMIYYEKVNQYIERIERLKELLASDEIAWKEKEKIIEEIKSIELDIESMKSNEETIIIFEWR